MRIYFESFLYNQNNNGIDAIVNHTNEATTVVGTTGTAARIGIADASIAMTTTNNNADTAMGVNAIAMNNNTAYNNMSNNSLNNYAVDVISDNIKREIIEECEDGIIIDNEENVEQTILPPNVDDNLSHQQILFNNQHQAQHQQQQQNLSHNSLHIHQQQHHQQHQLQHQQQLHMHQQPQSRHQQQQLRIQRHQQQQHQQQDNSQRYLTTITTGSHMLGMENSNVIYSPLRIAIPKKEHKSPYISPTGKYFEIFI